MKLISKHIKKVRRIDNKKLAKLFLLIAFSIILLLAIGLIISNQSTLPKNSIKESLPYNPISYLSGFVIERISNEKVIESFENENIDINLAIKDSTEILGTEVGKNNNERLEFTTSNEDNIKLYFDLLDYDEFVDEVVEQIVEEEIDLEIDELETVKIGEVEVEEETEEETEEEIEEVVEDLKETETEISEEEIEDTTQPEINKDETK